MLYESADAGAARSLHDTCFPPLVRWSNDERTMYFDTDAAARIVASMCSFLPAHLAFRLSITYRTVVISPIHADLFTLVPSADDSIVIPAITMPYYATTTHQIETREIASEGG